MRAGRARRGMAEGGEEAKDGVSISMTSAIVYGVSGGFFLMLIIFLVSYATLTRLSGIDVFIANIFFVVVKFKFHGLIFQRR